MNYSISPELNARLEREREEREEQQRRNFATLDPAAVLRLRPGMAEVDVVAALGKLWTPRVPTDKGYYFGLAGAGYRLRMDITGHIGSVLLHRASGLMLEGLQYGMTKAEALALYPQLCELPSDGEFGYTTSEGSLANGHLLKVRFDKDGILVGINIDLPGAKYHTGKERLVVPKGMYPKAVGKPGAPFADPNLKLAVLNALLRAGRLDLGTPQALADHAFKRHVDLEDEGYALLQPVYQYLTRYPLSPQQLDAVIELTFDGGLDIYAYVYPFWDGEDEGFDIHSFAGIEHCRNLRAIKVISMVADEADVESLQARLAQLRANP